MVTGPALERAYASVAPQAADNVAVGIEDARRRNRNLREVLLTPGLAQQRGRAKHRRCKRILVLENRGHALSQ